MADEKDKDKAPPQPPAPKAKVRVEVLVDNLGHKLKKRGDITDDPEYVELLKDKRKLVREVK